MRPGSSRLRVAIAAAFMIAVTACSSSGSDEPSTAGPVVDAEPTATPAPEPAPEEQAGASSSGSEGDFCEAANAFVTATDVRLVTAPDADVFAGIDQRLADLVAGAPDAMAEQLATLRAGYREIDTAYAGAGYEPTATISLPTDVLAANGRAAEELSEYLLAECDLGSVQEQQVADIALAFGIEDPALAECVHAQLGDVANITSSQLTPELLTTAVCETTLIDLLSGEGETES